MNLRLSNLFIAILLLVSCKQGEKAQTAVIKNSLPAPVSELVCQLNSDALMQSIASMTGQLIILDDETEIPYQLIMEGDRLKAVLIQANFNASEIKEITFKKGNPIVFAPKTQAEISIKEGGEWKWITKKNGNEQYEYFGGEWKNVTSLWVDEKHTDHSFDIRYEGPGWESDKIGYRFYLDWRNAVDLFGKKVDTLVLQGVGLDGFDSYHEMSPWGVDVLKVGDALGLGTIANWADSTANRVAKTDSVYSEVSYSGALESKITTTYYGWEYAGGKTDLTSELSIRAGSYLTKEHLISSNPMDNICTGIVKMPDTEVLQSTSADGKWSYLATYGVQSLQKDILGMVVFYQKKDLIEVTEDKNSHVVVLKPENNELTYFYGANWQQDASRLDSKEKFEAFINQQLELLNAGMIN